MVTQNADPDAIEAGSMRYSLWQLIAYALGLGATGLTFYDQAVTDAFSRHATGKRVMFLIAIGKPAR